MPGFDIVLEQVQPFDGIDLPTDVRISGTYTSRDTYTIDYVEIPSRDDPSAFSNPRDGWRIINALHPLYRGSTLRDGIGAVIDSAATADRIDAAIRAEMAVEHDDAPLSSYAFTAE